MKLNCKAGDLAVIVRSMAGNEGRIVRCLELVFDGGFFGYGPRWTTDPPVFDSDGNYGRAVLDACMRPLRDNDGEDEMLRIVGKPQPNEMSA